MFSLAQRLEAKPLSDNPNSQAGLVKLFRRKSLSLGNKDEEMRIFVDWRRAFLMFALMSGALPTETQK